MIVNNEFQQVALLITYATVEIINVEPFVGLSNLLSCSFYHLLPNFFLTAEHSSLIP